jgi:hypothetical protein
MRIEPSGVVFVGICSIQTDRCVAREPAPITAVWTSPARVQVNVCRPCLEEQVRAGEWEIRGARVKSRADVAVYSPDKKLRLVVEVKRAPVTETQLRDWAVRIHRNLLTHSGIPATRYFLLAALPDTLYLWREVDRHNMDRPPDYEVRAEPVLKDYFGHLPASPEKATEYELQYIVSDWLKDIAASKPTTDASLQWIEDSGLHEAIQNGSVVMQAPVAA